MMWESFLVKLTLGEGEKSKRKLPEGMWPVTLCCFHEVTSATFGIFDCCRALLAYWGKVEIHNCCQRSEMRCRRTLEGVEKWPCSISEREIRPDCGVSIIDRHLLSSTSCWPALKPWRRPVRMCMSPVDQICY